LDKLHVGLEFCPLDLNSPHPQPLTN
jgi:hypothetical protein